MLVDTYQENAAVTNDCLKFKAVTNDCLKSNDCVLEIWLRILSPLIPDTGTSELIYLLKQTERAYNAIW